VLIFKNIKKVINMKNMGRFYFYTILLMFIFIGQINASSHIPAGTLAEQLEESNLLTNIQELRLDGVTSKVSGGIVTLYNIRAISDTTTLNDYLEIDFLFDSESFRLIPIKLEKNEDLGVYFRDDYLFSKDVPADIFLKTPDGSTLPPNQLHSLVVSADDEFVMYMEAGTVLAQEVFDSSDDYTLTIKAPTGDIVSEALYQRNSRWVIIGTSILKSGDHIVQFTPVNSNSMSIDFSFTNNNRSPVRTLVSGSSVNSSLSAKGREYDKYKITLNTGDLLEVTDPVDDDVWLNLVNENSVRVENKSGKIFYQAIDSGDYYLFIINKDHNNGASYSGSVNITPDQNSNLYPVITKIERQSANINVEFMLQIFSSNVPDKYSVSGLPSGLTIDEVSGVISGVPVISGTFSIQVTVENEYGKDKERFLLTIKDISLEISPLQITTLGLSISAGVAPVSTTFSLEADGGSGNYVYAWDFKDGGSSTERSPAYEFVNPGTYNVQVAVTDVSDSNNFTTGELTVIVSAAPTPFMPLQITSLSSSVSVGEASLDVVFLAQASGGSGNYDYSWDFGDGQTSTEEAPTHIYSSANTYNVVLTVTDANDALKISIGELTIIVTDSPSVSTQPSQSGTVEASNKETSGGALGIWLFVIGLLTIAFRRERKES